MALLVYSGVVLLYNKNTKRKYNVFWKEFKMVDKSHGNQFLYLILLSLIGIDSFAHFDKKTTYFKDQRQNMLYDFHYMIQSNQVHQINETLADPVTFSAKYNLPAITACELCNMQNKGGRMSLHVSAGVAYDDTSVAQLLVKHGAKINAQDAFGWTPLFFPQNVNFSAYLLSIGADPAVTVNGVSALDYARAFKNTKKIKMLQNVLPLIIDQNLHSANMVQEAYVRNPHRIVPINKKQDIRIFDNCLLNKNFVKQAPRFHGLIVGSAAHDEFMLNQESKKASHKILSSYCYRVLHDQPDKENCIVNKAGNTKKMIAIENNQKK